ncbi:MAG: beta-galactosidase, partial [Alistipes sp.]|nr:beta-galactosidase [Alistipes sp.]
MKKFYALILFVALTTLCSGQDLIRKTIFSRDFSPAEGLVTPQERPYREEICLNGLWEVQCVGIPSSWRPGKGEAPELAAPDAAKWDKTKIKIPSPINVNNWGQGYNVGEGSRHPYAPSSVYFPSYPEHWNHARLAWLRRSFNIPHNWSGRRIVLHFEAVAGESRIVINGTEVHRNFESHLPFDVDITDYINYSGSNELLVGLRHTRLFDKSHPEYKYMGATYPTGSNTDDLIGIWQDVMLWAQPRVRIKDVFVQPWVDRGELLVELTIENTTTKRHKVTIGGDIREWINIAGKDILSAAEIDWKLGESALSIPEQKITLQGGESRKITLVQKVDGELKFWSPDEPNLYTLLLSLNDNRQQVDCKAERFGWRQFKIVGEDFHLNGKRIQCFGDIQHPFSAYICSRRFAYAWYQMIKDFGGNAVRPHAQPWPRVYYDLADEMGLMVLDETGVFGSSIRMNFEEDITWERSKEHLRRLILRDRNHPSVVGWSAGNETFAIALL